MVLFGTQVPVQQVATMPVQQQGAVQYVVPVAQPTTQYVVAGVQPATHYVQPTS